MSLAGRVVVSVVSHRVRTRDPAEESGQLAVFLWAQYGVPVIRHQFVGEQLDFEQVQALCQKPLKCRAVLLLVEDGRARSLGSGRDKARQPRLLVAVVPSHQHIRPGHPIKEA